MITMTVREGKLSAQAAKTGSPLPDIAETAWNASAYDTRSKTGAVFALARKLVDAGCPDQPWETRGDDGQRRLHGSSLHAIARLSVSSEPRPHFTKWAPRPDLEAEPDAP